MGFKIPTKMFGKTDIPDKKPDVPVNKPPKDSLPTDGKPKPNGNVNDVAKPPKDKPPHKNSHKPDVDLPEGDLPDVDTPTGKLDEPKKPHKKPDVDLPGDLDPLGPGAELLEEGADAIDAKGPGRLKTAVKDIYDHGGEKFIKLAFNFLADDLGTELAGTLRKLIDEDGIGALGGKDLLTLGRAFYHVAGMMI